MLTDTQIPVADQPGASPETTGASSGAVADTEAAAPAPSEGSATPTTPAAEAPSPYSLPDDLDLEQLVERNPGLKRYVDSKAGAIGDRLSKRQRGEIEQQVRQQLEAESHQRYLDSLVDQDDLVGLGELAKRQRLAERQQRDQSQASQQISRHAEATLGQAVVSAFSTLPNHLQAVLYAEDGKSFRRWAPGGSTADGIAEMLGAAIKAGVDHELRRLSPAQKAAIAEALQRERNGEALGSEASPDTRPGAPPRTRIITNADIARMTAAEYAVAFPRPNVPADGVDYRPNG